MNSRVVVETSLSPELVTARTVAALRSGAEQVDEDGDGLELLRGRELGAGLRSLQLRKRLSLSTRTPQQAAAL
jgi:hypothetical protein